MVKTNSIFELILATDIFFHLNANFTLILTKRLQLLSPRPPTGAPVPGPRLETPVPQTLAVSLPPQPWRQIDAYDWHYNTITDDLLTPLYLQLQHILARCN